MTNKERLGVYREGFLEGMQKALDIVNGNFDARRAEDDLVEIIARIVTDIQTEPPPKAY